MYIYIYIHIHIYTHPHTHTHAHTQLCIHIYTYTYTYIHTCRHIHAYTHTHTHTNRHAHTSALFSFNHRKTLHPCRTDHASSPPANGCVRQAQGGRCPSPWLRTSSCSPSSRITRPPVAVTRFRQARPPMVLTVPKRRLTLRGPERRARPWYRFSHEHLWPLEFRPV